VAPHNILNFCDFKVCLLIQTVLVFELNIFTRRFIMLSFLKKIFGAKPADTATPAPYKVEAPAAPVVTETPAAPAPKPAAKKATPAKPRAPRKPRAPKA
jgi:hypothetical protein